MDAYLLKEGNHCRLYERLGAHLVQADGVPGVYFAVWAPNARQVSVIGEFNAWEPEVHQLRARDDGCGVWEGFIPGVEKGILYKYHIVSNHSGYRVDKGDPYGFLWEMAPHTATVVWDLDYVWNDEPWM
ncbi:MAG: 1,4-alpha-glucan branching enzyme, partial [Bacteroidetes bacterium]